LLDEFSDDSPKTIRVALRIQRIGHIQESAITQIDASHETASLFKTQQKL
jgi:hypothetical protein